MAVLIIRTRWSPRDLSRNMDVGRLDPSLDDIRSKSLSICRISSNHNARVQRTIAMVPRAISTNRKVCQSANNRASSLAQVQVYGI